MATLRDLCKDVPTAIDAKALEYAINKRKNAAYLQRMGALREERDVFSRCQTRRPEKGKARNGYSREEAGTVGTQMTTRRFQDSYITVYCKSRKQY